MESELETIAIAWSRLNDIRIQLTPDAVRILSLKAYDEEKNLADVFADIFKDFEHGLNLIRGSQGIRFEITEDVVRDPKAALDKWIRLYYANNK
jgi:hypothetical protein